MTIHDVFALYTAHQYLPLFAFALLWARKLLSSESSFSKTLPPQWLPVVSMFVAAAYSALSSYQAGTPVQEAIAGALLAAVSAGFLDAMLTAFWNHGNAPAWAKKLVLAIDSAVAGGGSGGGGAGAAKAAAAVLLIFGLGGLVGIGTTQTGCTSAQAKSAETQVVDLTNAVCQELDAQPEPAWVYFACTIVQGGETVITAVTVKVPTAQAQAFAQAHPAGDAGLPAAHAPAH